MKFFVLLFMGLFLLETNAQVIQDANVVGLTSPVVIKDRAEMIPLGNLVEDPQMVTRVEASQGYTVMLSPDKQHVMLESSSRRSMIKLATITLYVGSKAYTYLIKKSEKAQYKFRLKDPEKVYKKVGIAGSFNDWDETKGKMVYEGDTWEITVPLSPGMWPYQFVTDGEWILDPKNDNQIDNNVGGFNSLVTIGESNFPVAKLELRAESFDEKEETVLVNMSNKTAWATMIVLWNNTLIEANLVEGKGVGEKGTQFEIKIPEAAKKSGRSFLRIFAASEMYVANDLLIPLENGKPVDENSQLTRADLHRQIMYFMMVDRFYNGDKGNDEPIRDDELEFKANYQGGDIAGLQQKIESGYFERLNVNSLWLSPITQNPLKAYKEYPEPHRKYSGYHGYWPISYDRVDHRFGNEQSMKSFVEVAHQKDMSVLLDFVCNHVHEEHPLIQEHPEWKTSLLLDDGTQNLRLWDDQRLTTWFDTFLPTIDLSKREAREVVAEAALYWIKEYDLDGFRHDATKHIPLEFWRHLTKRLKQEVIVPQNKAIYQIGETYGSHELINSYISNDLLDSQFDFNLYFTMKSVLLSEESSFETVVDGLNESFSYYGYNHLMGNMTGNHDQTRFISLAGGAIEAGEDEREVGWARDIQVKDLVGYQKLSLLEALTMTIPGIPVIYYGDEIGMPGAGDPDSRRMMRFEDQWTEKEKGVYNKLQKLTELRSENLALLYGDFNVLLVDKDILVFTRQYFDQAVVVMINKSGESQQIRQMLPPNLKDLPLQAQFGNEVNNDFGNLYIDLPANEFEILSTEY